MINFYDPKRSISKLQLAKAPEYLRKAIYANFQKKKFGKKARILQMNFQNVVPLYRQKIQALQAEHIRDVRQTYRQCLMNIYEMFDEHIRDV